LRPERAPGGAARPRVLLLEDDRAIQRFVASVAQDCGVDLHAVHRLAEADQALDNGEFDLLLADLMLPDGCAVEWLQHGRQADKTRYPRRIVAFSAGLGSTVRHALGLAGVDRFLAKPVSVDELQACFGTLRGAGDTQEPDIGCRSCEAGEPTPTASLACGDVAQTGVVERYFGGDAQLHADFLQTWRAGLPREVMRADQHLAASDFAAIRRVAHGMKSALRMLGETSLAQDSSIVEQRCVQRDGAGAALAWAHLRAGLDAWMARPGETVLHPETRTRCPLVAADGVIGA